MLQFSVGVGVQFQPKEGSKGSWQATNGWSHHCTRWWWRRWWWRRSWWWWTGDQQLKWSRRTIAGYLFWLDWLIAQLLVLITVNRHSEDCGCFWMPSSWTAARWGIFHLFEGHCTFGFQCRTAAGKIIKIPPFSPRLLYEDWRGSCSSFLSDLLKIKTSSPPPPYYSTEHLPR